MSTMLVSCIGVLIILEHGSNEIHLSTSERSHNVKRYTVYFIDQVNLNQQLKLEVKPCKKNFKIIPEWTWNYEVACKQKQIQIK